MGEEKEVLFGYIEFHLLSIYSTNTYWASNTPGTFFLGAGVTALKKKKKKKPEQQQQKTHKQKFLPYF